MFEALRANRTISRLVESFTIRTVNQELMRYRSKTISYGIWYSSMDRVHVTTAHGIHFSTMGYSISRTVQCNNTNNETQGPSSKLPKRLELLPEEALYLIERGALFCYKSVSSEVSLTDPSSYETQSPGVPMSVQEAFAEMIGREELTLERYQVTDFAILRAKTCSSILKLYSGVRVFETSWIYFDAR